ncbi:MAG: LysE family translocator [Cyclobacteriaceae bacterium]|nr:LysE family translocator [Cyclobacteriaceae bacterium]
MDALIQGILIGIVLSIMIGPVFFALIQTGMTDGFRAGWLMATGVIVSDAMYAMLTYFGISRLFHSPNAETAMAWAGAIILFGFGIKMVIKPLPKKLSYPKKTSLHRTLLKSFTRGFLLNGINPFVIIFWLSVASAASVKFGYTGTSSFNFYFSALLVVYISDLLKVYTAKKLRNFVSSKTIVIINRIAGTALILFGIRLLVYAW